MSYCPKTPKEIDEFFKDFFEVCKKLDQTPHDFQQAPCSPQTADDTMFHGNQMVIPSGNLAFHEQQKKDCDDQINHYGQMTSCSSMSIHGGEQSHSKCQISVYRGEQNLWIHQQMTSPVGSQPLWDSHLQTPGLDVIQQRIMSTKYNLFQCPETTPTWKDHYLGKIKTTLVDEIVYSAQKASPTGEESHSVQMTSFGNQAPPVDGSTYSASSFGAKSQIWESFSVLPSGHGQLPQEKSHLDTQSPVTQKNSPTGRFFCTYQGCGKSYTKSFHLKDHMKKHTGKKVYVCSEPGCQWKFYYSGDLQRHKRKHGGQRLHPCDRCNKNFSRLYYLKQHQRVCPGASSNPGS